MVRVPAFFTPNPGPKPTMKKIATTTILLFTLACSGSVDPTDTSDDVGDESETDETGDDSSPDLPGEDTDNPLDQPEICCECEFPANVHTHTCDSSSCEQIADDVWICTAPDEQVLCLPEQC